MNKKTIRLSINEIMKEGDYYSFGGPLFAKIPNIWTNRTVGSLVSIDKRIEVYRMISKKIKKNIG